MLQFNTKSMKAILWDGNKQLRGRLMFGASSLQFRMDDFEKTDLNFDLQYEEIQDVKSYKLYGLDLKGVRIVTHSGKENVFVLEDEATMKDIIRHKSKFQNI